MIRKELWGPHLWYSIHFIALGFPNDASSIDKKNYKNFYISLPNVIPCEECSKHLINSLNQFPIDNFLLNKDKLFEWTVIIHNEVNKRKYYNFFMNLKDVLPCKKCQAHYKENIQKYDLSNNLDSRQDLVQWLIDIHNEVNKLLNKEIWSVDRAKLFYNNFNINKTTTCKTTNNINNLYIILIIILIIIIGVLIKKKL